ncbi:diacylglyceryl transferase [Thioclava sp. SK-1]|uniref:YbjN domain-containing protein n=1 Tax=Thioclava sp. SK-1 TaxID=1889770 RepID=UPI0008268B06|nr:YbjN domain-containing protein [Thioclava sp. SK-1]OCX66714.1 diacylglyceryl transferase [Thioclava sp. SK-1]
MALSDDYFGGDAHPIDVVEDLAEAHAWEFNRVADDQIAMMVEGQWRSYSITLVWSDRDEMLRLIMTFEMDPPSERLPVLYDMMNRANDQVWSGAFTYWPDQRLMAWRYGLTLTGGQCATIEQLDHMIGEALMSAERYYPAFQVGCWGDQSAESAIRVAIADAVGHA